MLTENALTGHSCKQHQCCRGCSGLDPLIFDLQGSINASDPQ